MEIFVQAIANLMSATAQILWPLLFVAVVILLRREIRTLLQPGAEFILDVGIGKLSIKPTKPPMDKSELPPVPEAEPLPPDYFFINHTSFLREEMQPKFQSRTWTDLPHYDIRVIVDSYYHGALDRIDRVEYYLHEASPHPIQVRTNRDEKYLLKEVANGEYVLLAKIFVRGRSQPLLLQRYITLWKEGPRLNLAG